MEVNQVVDNVFTLIDKGRLGENIGLTTGIPKLNKVIDGVQRGIYTLIFAGTGAGKSSIALKSYIFEPMMEKLGDDSFKAVIYSLEMSNEVVLCKLLSLYIWKKYNIELSYKDILSKQKKLEDKYYNILIECKEWLNLILDKHIIIYDKALNADKLYASLSGILEKLGTTIDLEHRKVYIPNNPNQVLVTMIDHIGLVRKSPGRSKKEEIDLISNYLVTLRNRCKISPVVIMQSNRTGMSMDRRNAGMQEPQLEDIKESGSPSEDAEVVLALFYPHREKMVTYRGYKIAKELKDKFRSIVCLKNRFGDCDVAIGTNFFGSVGEFREMPLAEEIVDYAPYLDINGMESIKIEKENKEDNLKKFKLEI